VVGRALGTATELGARDPSLARRLFALLATPFAVGVLDLERAGARLSLGRHLDAASLAGAMEREEPWVPWRPSVLASRQAAYRDAHHPRERQATEELQEFWAQEPPTLLSILIAEGEVAPAPAPQGAPVDPPVTVKAASPTPPGSDALPVHP
jgi:spermidine synthase